MGQDYQTGTSRLGEDHNTTLARLGSQYNTSNSRLNEDNQTYLNRLGSDYSTTTGRLGEDHNQFLDRLGTDYTQASGRLNADHSTVMSRLNSDYGTSTDRLGQDHGTTLARLADAKARSQYDAGLKGTFDASGNPTGTALSNDNQYGAYQQMLAGQANALSGAESVSRARGLGGKGLGAQGVQALQYQQGADRQGLVNNVLGNLRANAQQTQDENTSYGRTAADLLSSFNRNTQDENTGYDRQSADMLSNFNRTTQDENKGYGRQTADLLSNFNRSKEDQGTNYNRQSSDLLTNYNNASQDENTGYNRNAADMSQNYNRGVQAENTGYTRNREDLTNSIASTVRDFTNSGNDLNYQHGLNQYNLSQGLADGYSSLDQAQRDASSQYTNSNISGLLDNIMSLIGNGDVPGAGVGPQGQSVTSSTQQAVANSPVARAASAAQRNTAGTAAQKALAARSAALNKKYGLRR
jgi:hypothetical protein